MVHLGYLIGRYKATTSVSILLINIKLQRIIKSTQLKGIQHLLTALNSNQVTVKLKSFIWTITLLQCPKPDEE